MKKQKVILVEGTEKPRRQTVKERIDDAYKAGLHCGEYQGRQQARQESTEQDRLIKKAQVEAVTALINASTAALGKAGYLISQLNKEKGW